MRNIQLKNKLSGIKPKPALSAAIAIPAPNTVNLQSAPAYKQDCWLKLLSLLNTSKVDNQFYRTASQTLVDLKSIIKECATIDAYLTAQCIVYSRVYGEGMRSINHVAAALIAPYIAGKAFAQRFYTFSDRSTKTGGTLFRPDDMKEIQSIFHYITGKTITNAMRKGFKSALESMNSHGLLKYGKDMIDMIRLARPAATRSKATVKYNNESVKTIEALIKGYKVSADTWEVANSEAGQIVAEAVKIGKVSSFEAEALLSTAKGENWKGLLKEGKLGILAGLRNIRNILTDGDDLTVQLLRNLLTDKSAIINGKIMPYQIDIANSITINEFSGARSRAISQALLIGYEAALPNLRAALSGRNLVIIDCSGSMHRNIVDPIRKISLGQSAADKAALIGATIAKSTNADVILFGGTAKFKDYNINASVFDIANSFKEKMGATNLDAAWRLAATRKYDRVFILSDYECNRGSTYDAYKSYVTSTGDPYVYSVDLAAYGTNAIAGPKVRYYYGYGYSFFADISNVEFDANYHLKKVKEIKI